MQFRSVAVAACCLLALVACNDDGRTLEPAPEVPVSRETTSTSTGFDAGATTESGAAAGLALASTAFADGGFLDAEFTCEGTNVPPPLTIRGVPAAAAEVAIVVLDRDAEGFVHWVVTGIDPAIGRLDGGAPPGAIAARTDSGVEGWDGPCPPRDDGPHDYVFTVYAAAEPIGLAAGLDGRDAIPLIEAAAVASDSITARYEAAS
ncbi:MAG: YbhB/YbcL family Raf kinase inhibitor-like protein [Acidimicrobiales bacterium]|nr:YbhB/YbcL family Raf kinase inhibitor-like protein [Acidimicrobiales bacterium]